MSNENHNGGNGEDHTCIRQEDFKEVQKATDELKLDLALNTQMTGRLESAVTKMVESVQKLSDGMIKIQATQVTSDVFTSKFDEMGRTFRAERDKAVQESMDRDKITHKRIDPLVKTVDRHDLYFIIMGVVILAILTNPGDIIAIIQKVI